MKPAYLFDLEISVTLQVHQSIRIQLLSSYNTLDDQSSEFFSLESLW